MQANQKICVKLFSLNVDAVAAASLFHFKEITPQDCKIHLKANNVNIR